MNLLNGLEGSKQQQQQQQSSTVSSDRFSGSDTMPNRGRTFILLGKQSHHKIQLIASWS